MGDYSYAPNLPPMGMNRPAIHRQALWSDALFVDYDNGNAGNVNVAMNNPDYPLKTVQAAVTAARRGAVVYIRERPISGYDPQYLSENITIPVAKQGISLIGTGASRKNGWGCGIKGAAAGAVIIVRAPFVNIENLTINKGSSTTGHIRAESSSTDATKKGFGLNVYNCHLRNANQITAGAIYLDNVWDVLIQKCMFISCVAGIVGAATVDSLANIAILDNQFYPAVDDPTAAALDVHILLNVLTYNLLIDNNKFLGPIPALSAGTYKVYAYLGTSCYGMMSHNYFQDTNVTKYAVAGSNATSACIPSTVLFVDNYAQGAVAAVPIVHTSP